MGKGRGREGGERKVYRMPSLSLSSPPRQTFLPASMFFLPSVSFVLLKEGRKMRPEMNITCGEHGKKGRQKRRKTGAKDVKRRKQRKRRKEGRQD
jgi:hypothetical protein